MFYFERTWGLLRILHLSYIVIVLHCYIMITRLLSRWLLTLFFMRGLSILRLMCIFHVSVRTSVVISRVVGTKAQVVDALTKLVKPYDFCSSIGKLGLIDIFAPT